MKHVLKASILALSFLAGSSAVMAADKVPTTAAAAKQAASADSPELAAFKKAIRAKYDMKEKAFANHDAETIVTKFYTADVVSVDALGQEMFVGRDQLRPLYLKHVQDSLVKIDSVHTFVNGDTGWDWADFHVKITDGKTKPFTLAILFLWTKVNGVWMCKGDFIAMGSLREGKILPQQMN